MRRCAGCAETRSRAGEVRALQLLKVHSAQDLRLWNESMCEHPQGAGVMVGAQLRYLIGSEHGWLGGLGFGASAIKLGDRDQWIGWDVRQQREHMHRVIGMCGRRCERAEFWPG